MLKLVKVELMSWLFVLCFRKRSPKILQMNEVFLSGFGSIRDGNQYSIIHLQAEIQSDL